MYENRLEFNLGNGNRKTRTRPGSDDAPANSRQYPNTHAASQVAQELPGADRSAWVKDLFRPETADEAEDRFFREMDRMFCSEGCPNSLEFGLEWAQLRLQEGAKWRKIRRIF